MVDVFLSYAREDQARAESLLRLLDAEGWSVWWDQEIRIGKTWGQEIEKALGLSKAVIVLWTKDAVASEWVINEATYAHEYDKLFGVQMKSCKVPEPFPELQFANLVGWTGARDDPELTRLLKSLSEHVPPSRTDTVRPGYDSCFLGDEHRVAWPSVHGTARQLHYLHFSVVMNPARRLAWYAAYNADLRPREVTVRRPIRWVPDPLVVDELQPGDQHFKHSGYDRGHLVAPILLAWGEPRQARIAAHQAYFWTNTAPQHPNLNRGSYLSVERWERAIAERYGRLIGFCGPIFCDDDPPFRDEQPGDDGFVAYETFRIPRAYWKVVVALDPEGALIQRGFSLENPELETSERPRRTDPANLTIDLAQLEDVTGLEFPAVLKHASQLPIRVS